eukprot:4922835-Amphidinium_carterae.1
MLWTARIPLGRACFCANEAKSVSEYPNSTKCHELYMKFSSICMLVHHRHIFVCLHIGQLFALMVCLSAVTASVRKQNRSLV